MNLYTFIALHDVSETVIRQCRIFVIAFEDQAFAGEVKDTIIDLFELAVAMAGGAGFESLDLSGFEIALFAFLQLAVGMAGDLGFKPAGCL